ncbi:MAG TPA: PAS domain S-box protein, partial [Promineifilum sp.]|nr:PAS domain S-box protein [Promineifilum sp.]
MSTPTNIWGAAIPGLSLSGPLAFSLALLLASLVLLVLYRLRAAAVPGTMTRQQWLVLGALCLASLALSQLLPLRLPWADPLLREHPVTAFLALFAAVPALLAGAALNIPAAIVVGLFAGLGRALGQTGSPADILAAGLAAGASAWLMQQNYSGRLFRALRQPVVAGLLGWLLWGIITVLDILASMWPQMGLLAALDLALFLGAYALIPLTLEGLTGGLLAMLLLWIAPQWRPARGLVPSPLRRSLQRQLTAAFLSFVAVVLLVSALLVFLLSARFARQAIAGQMAANTDAVAVRLGTLQRDLATALAAGGADPALAAADPGARSAALSRLLRAAPQFSQVDAIAAPADLASLTPAESALVADALASGEARFGLLEAAGERHIGLALPHPGSASDGVLLGHVSTAALEAVVANLSPTDGASGLVVDEGGRVVLAAGPAQPATEWAAPPAEQAALALGGGRVVYRARAGDGARQLVYYVPVPPSGWRVVAVVPQARILRAALGVMGPLALLLAAVSGLFVAYVAGLGRAIVRPLGEISQASRAIAGGGGLERPVRSRREDEIGQLSLAFSQMQRALRQRLDELSLLLGVSNDVAATVNLGEGMVAVLQGVLRGTGAAGARAVIRNPNGPAPLVFAEGPAAESMAPLDRAVVRRMRAEVELGLTAPEELDTELGAAPVAALFALPLRLAGEYQGALYLGYRQPHYFDSDERNLLRTLAGQASVLVQNAYLFAAAEGGRRRLAAVLASTPNAVIVTDQTDRVLLLNPAMERVFGLRAADAIGRPVVDVLAGSETGRTLAQQLTAGQDVAADNRLDLAAGGRDFLAGVSIVSTSDGQAIGRVAVLQDVTDLKEVDRLKSEFLDGISHDLRSPLTYMRNYASLLPLPDDPALEQQYVNKIAA